MPDRFFTDDSKTASSLPFERFESPFPIEEEHAQLTEIHCSGNNHEITNNWKSISNVMIVVHTITMEEISSPGKECLKSLNLSSVR